MLKWVLKRDGRKLAFDKSRITSAVYKAARATGEKLSPEEFSSLVVDELLELGEDYIPRVEEIQDIVERLLIEKNYVKTARAYILYREQHARIRRAKGILMDVDKTIDGYLEATDWRTRENANADFSFSGLMMHAAGTVIAHYTLENVYPGEVSMAHRRGALHIHDLSMGLAGYCAGWNLRQLLEEGFNGVERKVEAGPSMHLETALGQMVNFLGTLQNEWAGAMAFNSFDTYLAPYVRKDKLSYNEVKQSIQRFCFSVNVASRWGGQTPFVNLTFDWRVPSDLKNERVTINGEYQSRFGYYGDFQREMNLINRAFIEVMTEGDKSGRVFTFPIPTYNITKDFDWDSENSHLLFKMTAKYGLPYFQNFINSNLNPSDVRSMCCHLRLDLRKLERNVTGGLFGSSDSTGSIGVVTINMPRIGYLSKTEKEYFESLSRVMNLAKESLEIKRKVVERNIQRGLLPYTKRYLGSLKNHFSTIGLLGMNESCINFMGKDIGTDEGRRFALKVLNFMLHKLQDFQEETGNIYNLEATPAEGSLAPDENVLISKSSPRLTKIGPLVDTYMKNNENKIKRVGTVETLRLNNDELFTYAFSKKSQRIQKYPVTSVIRHKGQSMYEIILKSGRRVKVTGKHSVFTINKFGEPERVLVSNLRNDMVIAIAKKINIKSNAKKEFNLISEFKDSSIRNRLYVIAPGDFIKQLLKKKDVKEWLRKNYKTSYRNIKYAWEKSCIFPLRIIYELNIEMNRAVLEKSRIFYRKTKNTKPVNVLIKNDRDLGFLIGSLLAEGWISDRSEFVNTDKGFISQFVSHAENVFGHGSCRIALRERSKEQRKLLYTVTIGKMASFVVKYALGVSGKSNNKSISPWVFASDDEVGAALLRAFTLGDGYIYKNKEKKDYSIRLYTNSNRLMQDLNLLLLKLGILAKIRKDLKSMNQRWKDNYVLSITGAENLKKYFALILEQRFEISETNSGREIIPVVSETIKNIMKKYRISARDIGIDKDSLNRNVRDNRISLQFLRKIVDKLDKKIKAKEIERIKISINSDIFWDRILDIKPIKAPEYVYDFEVASKNDVVENFLGGEGLVCLHNTSYRLAKIDKKEFPDIITAGGEVPYYTNSTQLPVGYTDDVFEAFTLQEELQSKYTGGTVLHAFIGEQIQDEQICGRLVRKLAENFKVPYFTISPTFSICKDHGYIPGEKFECPICGKKTEVYSRVVGYLRPVQNWNKGKQEEFKERKVFKVKGKMKNEK
jgi:ribonucleoside-triphosphate reductase